MNRVSSGAPGDNRQADTRRRLGVLKIASPLLHATIVRPGMEADDYDIGNTVGLLIQKTRELVDHAAAQLALTPDDSHGRWATYRLAVEIAHFVAQHWERHSKFSREDMQQLIDGALQIHQSLPDLDEPPYTASIAKAAEWSLTWARLSISVTNAVMMSESGLGHPKAVIAKTLIEHMTQSVRDWANEFAVADANDRLTIEQSLATSLSHSYIALWLKEIEDVKVLVSTMHPDQRKQFQSKPYDLDLVRSRCTKMISTLKEMANLVGETLEPGHTEPAAAIHA